MSSDMKFSSNLFQAKGTTADKLRKLVDYLKASSVHEYIRFLEALDSAGIHQLDTFFAETRGVYPLNNGTTVLKLVYS